jgi:hypothetical protein
MKIWHKITIGHLLRWPIYLIISFLYSFNFIIIIS